MEKNKKYFIDVVVDCIIVKDGVCLCLFDFFEVVLCLVDGVVVVDIIGGEKIFFFEYYVCLYGDFLMFELELWLFFFNVLLGVCLVCEGFGSKLEVDVDFVVFD